MSETEKQIKMLIRNRKTNKKADSWLQYKSSKKFQHASKVDKRKSELKFKKIIAEGVKLKNKKIAEINKRRKKQKTICLKNYFTNYQSPSDMYKKLRETEGKKMRIE